MPSANGAKSHWNPLEKGALLHGPVFVGLLAICPSNTGVFQLWQGELMEAVQRLDRDRRWPTEKYIRAELTRLATEGHIALYPGKGGSDDVWIKDRFSYDGMRHISNNRRGFALWLLEHFPHVVGDFVTFDVTYNVLDAVTTDVDYSVADGVYSLVSNMVGNVVPNKSKKKEVREKSKNPPNPPGEQPALLSGDPVSEKPAVPFPTDEELRLLKDPKSVKDYDGAVKLLDIAFRSLTLRPVDAYNLVGSLRTLAQLKTAMESSKVPAQDIACWICWAHEAEGRDPVFWRKVISNPGRMCVNNGRSFQTGANGWRSAGSWLPSAEPRAEAAPLLTDKLHQRNGRYADPPPGVLPEAAHE